MKVNALDIYTILQLSAPSGVKDSIIEHLAIDSRNIAYPQTTLFIAIDGAKQSGSDFIFSLFEIGVRYFIVQERHKSKFDSLDANFYWVEDSIAALQKIVSQQRIQYTPTTIGITGSNGKTIVKEWLSQILTKTYTICKTPKSYNSQVGVPLSVWSMNDAHNLAIFEAGISQPNEMETLETMIRPNIGILTNIGDAHQANFSTVQEKLKEKLKLFIHSEILIIQDKTYLENNVVFDKFFSTHKNIRRMLWGSSSLADVQISENIASRKLNILWCNKNYQITLPKFEQASIENCCHCIAAILCLTDDLSPYLSLIENLSPLEMRLEIVEGSHQTTLINDTYNADIESLSIAVQFLHQQAAINRSIILSEIHDTGAQTIPQMIEILSSISLDYLILIGEAYDGYLELFRNLSILHFHYYHSTTEFIKKFNPNHLKNQTILIKGARRFQLDEIVSLYRKKTHSTYLKVHLNALKHNLTEYAKRLQPETKIMIMLKASGYGLGSLEIAKLLESEKRASYYAVAYTDEGVELREAGIQKPIMVLNPEVNALSKLIEYRLEPEVYSLGILKKIISELKPYHSNFHLPIHLKLETGMHRLGIPASDLDGVLEILNSQPHIKVQSIMTHLAASDEAKLDAFTGSQFEEYNSMVQLIESSIGYAPLKQVLNSGGILRHPEYQHNMVRLGIGLFGFDSTDIIQSNLQSSFTLISKIAQIKKVIKGDSIGYSRSGRAHRDSLIGIINIGYADGYSRLLGNGKTQVYIKNQYAPTIGNICMDMTMIDLTECVGIEEGDEVELIGHHIPASLLAHIMDTIPYEIMTSISNRVQRVYWEE